MSLHEHGMVTWWRLRRHAWMAWWTTHRWLLLLVHAVVGEQRVRLLDLHDQPFVVVVGRVGARGGRRRTHIG